MNGISLGEDLETEILARLPVKSLMRFKSVQRSWNVLFKTPTFVTRHMQTHMSGERSLMILHEHGDKPYITLLSCNDLTPTCPLIKSIFPDNSANAMSIFSLGHCNGVFCLNCCPFGSRSQLILWNPSTREVHLIPPPPSHYRNLCHPIVSLCGFGADLNTNDLKVVNLNMDFKMNYSLSSAEIYNLSTKSWTHIHLPVLPSPTIIAVRLWPSKYNTLVNSVYHWITGYSSDGFANILCFDFSNNRFRELRGPISRLVSDAPVRDEIAEVNGSLAFVVEYLYDGPVRLGIWVMDQQGWVKKYSIGPIEPLICICGVWKDGSQVLGGKVGRPLTSYDHDGNPIRQFQYEIVPSEYFWIHEYVQSIAPLST